MELEWSVLMRVYRLVQLVEASEAFLICSYWCWCSSGDRHPNDWNSSSSSRVEREKTRGGSSDRERIRTAREWEPHCRLLRMVSNLVGNWKRGKRERQKRGERRERGRWSDRCFKIPLRKRLQFDSKAGKDPWPTNRRYAVRYGHGRTHTWIGYSSFSRRRGRKYFLRQHFLLIA